MSERQTAGFPALFTRLRTTMQPLVPPLVAKVDEPGNYYLECPPSSWYPKGLYFGAVQTRKRYVSFHLMPVYAYPDLLEGISERLRKRMQGKSCFNFTHPDEELLGELTRLTHDSFARFQREQLV